MRISLAIVLSVMAGSLFAAPVPIVESSVISSAFCSESNQTTSISEASGPVSLSCTENGISKNVITDFNSMKAAITVTSDGPQATTHLQHIAFSGFTDSVFVAADASNPAGPPGSVSMIFEFDGRMSGESFFEIYAGLYDSIGDFTPIYDWGIEYDYTVTGPDGVLNRYAGVNAGGFPLTRFDLPENDGTEEYAVEGTWSVTFPAAVGQVSGEYLGYTYTHAFYAGADNSWGVGGSADFLSTATLVDILVFDDTGAEVDATITLQSGATIGRVTPVPLPISGWMLAGGLLGLGLFRRKTHALPRTG